MIDGSVLPMVPSVQRRLKALRRLGSTLAPVARAAMPLRAMPPLTMLVVAPLTVLAGVLMVCVVALLTWVSTMLFTPLPGGALHALLRGLARRSDRARGPGRSAPTRAAHPATVRLCSRMNCCT